MTFNTFPPEVLRTSRKFTQLFTVVNMDALKLKFKWHSEECRYMPNPSVRRKLLLSSFSGVLWLVPSVYACALSCFSCVQLFVRRRLCPWVSTGKNAGVGHHVLLQGTFLTQGSNPISYVSWTGRQVLYHQRLLGSPGPSVAVAILLCSGRRKESSHCAEHMWIISLSAQGEGQQEVVF